MCSFEHTQSVDRRGVGMAAVWGAVQQCVNGSAVMEAVTYGAGDDCGEEVQVVVGVRQHVAAQAHQRDGVRADSAADQTPIDECRAKNAVPVPRPPGVRLAGSFCFG